MIKVIPPRRGTDKYGSGHYGASRGNRKHKGIDLAVMADSYVCSNTMGEVTKLGYPYKDHREYRYVEITTDGLRHRYFYVDPLVEVGDLVVKDAIIGKMQDLELIYPNGMTNHLHYEILDQDGNDIDPESYLIVATG